MISLASLKMHKILRAVLEKNYSRKPSEEFSSRFFIDRIRDELKEMEELLDKNEVYQEKLFEALKECADISNLTDFLFDRLLTQRVKHA